MAPLDRGCGMPMGRLVPWAVFHVDAFPTSQGSERGAPSLGARVPGSQRGQCLGGGAHSSDCLCWSLGHGRLCQGKPGAFIPLAMCAAGRLGGAQGFLQPRPKVGALGEGRALPW